MNRSWKHLLLSAVACAALTSIVIAAIGSAGVTGTTLPGEDPQLDAVCSPPPECWSDRDCNRICGKKTGGSCVVVNSCYRVCSCNAT